MTRRPDNYHGDDENADTNPRASAGKPKTDRKKPPENSLAENEYQAEVEPFVPTDFYLSTHVCGKHGKTRRKKRVLWAVLLVFGIILLAVGGVFAYALLLDPGAQFADAGKPNPEDIVSVESDGSTAKPGQLTPTPVPTPDQYEIISAQEDKTISQQHIVNVLLIGVDYAEERETWKGKHEYHSDVMIVMAINFDENRVDLISLPRDTYAKIPGVKGIYKLNASLNCGGGFEAPGGAGFLKTCEAANWMLGEVADRYPINYYYAVTMPAVKQLVNAIGGVDYDLDVSFTMMGRSYNAGPTHLNGQGVLDYLRVRKKVKDYGDLNRINRQKKMLIAIFETMRKQNLILKVPDILNSFEGQLYTNCTFAQTAALAKFAYTLDQNNIGMYSMDGSMEIGIFNWNFCLTDQTKRVQIIKDVYGINVPKELEYTADYGWYRWRDILATHYIDTTQPLVEFVSQALAEDDLLPTMSPTPEPTATPTPEVVTPAPDPETPSPETPSPEITTGTSSQNTDTFGIVRLSALSPVRNEIYRRYTEQARTDFNNFLMSLDDLEEVQAIARKEAAKYAAGKSNNLKQAAQDVADYSSHVKTNAIALAAEFGYPASNFTWSYRYDLDPDFNEIKVDFN